jgi:hypothetical protein
MTTRILIGDCRDVLKTLPDDSVHCCVTSPPYWALRSYLPAEHPNKHLEIGSEPTLQQWVDTMVEVFREVRRVLRPDGMVADRQHKHAILIDLDERNLPMATERIKGDSPLFAEVSE